MKRTYLGLMTLFIGFGILAGCGYDDVTSDNGAGFKPPVITPAKPYEKKAAAKYVYAGDRRRDPFVPLIGMSPAGPARIGETGTPNVGALTLKGLFDDGSQRSAMISGGGITYILKGSHLYDNHRRLIKGITGIIKQDSVIIIGPDRTAKELKLREK